MDLDIWRYIGNLLNNDKDRYHLMVTCKTLKKLHLKFCQKQKHHLIIKSLFYNDFTNIVIDDKSKHVRRLPKHILKLKIKKYDLKKNLNMFKFGITHLNFDCCVQYLLEGFIPSSVTHLDFSDYDQEINGNCVPESVTHLSLGETDYLPNIPLSVIFLEIINEYPLNTIIPTSIKYLYIGTLTKDVVPESVTHLMFHECEENFIDCIPTSVTHLEIGHVYDDADEYLPSSITYLVLDIYDYNANINIPTSVTHLVLNGNFNKNIPDIPSSVTHLTFGDFFNQNLNNKIPNSVTHLQLGRKFNKSIYLCKTVTHLMIHENYKGIIPKKVNVTRNSYYYESPFRHVW